MSTPPRSTNYWPSSVSTGHAPGLKKRLAPDRQQTPPSHSLIWQRHHEQSWNPSKGVDAPRTAPVMQLGVPGHERVSSATAARNHEKEPPGHSNGQATKRPPKGPIRENCPGSEASKPLNRETLCPRWDSNPHTFRYRILSAARLPIPPLGRGVHRLSYSPAPWCCEQRDRFRCAKLLYMQIG